MENFRTHLLANDHKPGSHLEKEILDFGCVQVPILRRSRLLVLSLCCTSGNTIGLDVGLTVEGFGILGSF